MHNGRLIAIHGQHCLVETVTGDIISCTRRKGLKPICGDYVEWEDNHRIASIQTRKNELIRPDFRGYPRSIAANLDQLILVIAPEPVTEEPVIDRALITSRILNLAPILLFNKIDQLDDTAHATLEKRITQYQQLGFQTHNVSASSGQGLAHLESLLADKVSALVGQSGVGKSSLTEQLIPNKAIRIGEISAVTGLGKHTTTATTLYHLPHGGELIDSPGARDFALWQMPLTKFLCGFTEFYRYLDSCRFHNCRHLVEPKCAIKAAVANGQINQRLYDAYVRFAPSIIEEWQ